MLTTVPGAAKTCRKNWQKSQAETHGPIPPLPRNSLSSYGPIFSGENFVLDLRIAVASRCHESCALLSVHQDYQALLGKRMSRIRTGESNRNFTGNSRTSADSHFVVHRTHIPVYRFATTPQKRCVSFAIRVRRQSLYFTSKRRKAVCLKQAR